VPSSAILLLEQDPATAEIVRSVLVGVGYQVNLTEDPEEVFRLAGDHVLVIIDAVREGRTPVEICKEIRGTPALAAVPVLCIAQTEDVEERVRFLEAGADDVMVKPFDARELEARVEALLLRFHRSRDLAPAVVPGAAGATSRRVVVFFSPKGGVGTTTLAVNSAVALAERRPDRVALIDLDLQWGQVATHLNLRPTQTIGDLARDEQAFSQPELLRTYMVRHEAGLSVLCAPQRPDQAQLVGATQVGAMIESARRAFEIVVVDGGSTLDERSLTLFELADAVIFTVYPEIGALKALHSLLETLSDAVATGSKTSFVVNHLFAREMLKLRDIENTLAARISLEIPYDPVVYLKAVNEGIPVVRGAPRSGPAERLHRLAAIVSGEFAVEHAGGDAARGRGLLGGLLKRG
jgi:pilus assembly protein CpaE